MKTAIRISILLCLSVSLRAAYPTASQVFPVTSSTGSIQVVIDFHSPGTAWGYLYINGISSNTNYHYRIGPSAASVAITDIGSGGLSTGTGQYLAGGGYFPSQGASIAYFFNGGGYITGVANTIYINVAIMNGSGTGAGNTWVILGAQKFSDENTVPVRKKLTFTGTNSSAQAQSMGIHKTGTGQVFDQKLVPAGGTYTGTVDVLSTDTASYKVATVDVNAKSATGEQVNSMSDANGNFGADFGSPQYFTDQGTAQTQAAGAVLVTPSSSPIASSMSPTGATMPASSTSPASNPFDQSTGGQTASGAPTGAPTQGSTAANTNAITAAISKLGQQIAASSGGSSGGTDMTATNTKLDAIKTGIDGLETKAQTETKVTDAQTAATSSGNTKATAMSGEMSTAQGTANGIGTSINSSGLLSDAKGLRTNLPVPTDNGHGTATHNVTVVGGGLVGAMSSNQIDTNPFTSPLVASVIGAGSLTAWAAWVRSCVGWCIVVGFLVYTGKEINKTVMAVTVIQPRDLGATTKIALQTMAAGFSVGVIPAGIMWTASVVVISTLVAAAPVIIVAAFADVGGAASLVTSGIASATSANGATGFVANALSYTNKFLPLTLMLTAMVNGVFVQITAVTQYIVYGLVIKLIPF